MAEGRKLGTAAATLAAKERAVEFNSKHTRFHNEYCEIPLRYKGEIIAWTLVDLDDYEWAQNHLWSLDKGYAFGGTRRDGGSLHRQLLKLSNGDGVVDHINGDPLDNRRKNLRVVETKDNNRNRTVINKHGRYRGVSKRKGKKFEAVVSIGYFDTELEAAIVAAKLRYLLYRAPQDEVFLLEQGVEIEILLQNNSITLDKSLDKTTHACYH